VTISSKIIKQLGSLVAGDKSSAPYLSGPKLVDFFNECGFGDVYGAGFPSRWAYAAEKIALSNGTSRLQTIIEEFVDPRRYGGNEELVLTIVHDINALIKYDGLELSKNGAYFRIKDTAGNFIEPKAAAEMGHEFINEQIAKCRQKISDSDFSGAITNARTLVEAVLIHIIEQIGQKEIKNDGNISNLWTKAKKCLKIELKKEDFPDFVFQIISGLDTSLGGLSALSNNAGDRHANKFNTEKHHAKLAVNLALTISDFLIEVLNRKKMIDN